MTKPAQMMVAMVLGLIMTPFAAFMTSKVAKVQTSVHAAISVLSPAEKQACRELIQPTLVLGWEDSHYDMALALAIGRKRLPEAKRAHERSCDAAVAQ